MKKPKVKGRKAIKPRKAWTAVWQGELVSPCDECRGEREYRRVHSTAQWRPKPTAVIPVLIIAAPARARGRRK